MAIVIEPATSADLPAILALLEQHGLPAAGLSDHLTTALVAREGVRIVGSAALERYTTAALLRSVAVDASLRRRGLGQRLTLAALDLARAQGLREIYLLTETAADFFPRFGFRPVARAQVHPDVRQSVEFTSACPASAEVMRLTLDADHDAAMLGSAASSRE